MQVLAYLMKAETFDCICSYTCWLALHHTECVGCHVGTPWRSPHTHPVVPVQELLALAQEPGVTSCPVCVEGGCRGREW
jgi:hypothetical protein